MGKSLFSKIKITAGIEWLRKFHYWAVVEKEKISTINPFCSPGRQRALEAAFSDIRSRGLRSIPVFIISYNRLSYLKALVERLEALEMTNIHIIDNASTYPPLLEYYRTLPYEIHYMGENVGFMVFWERDEFAKYRKDFHIVTDPDVVPTAECPKDFIKVFLRILMRYPNANKVGFSLKSDDLPPDGLFTEEVLTWERQFNHPYLKKINAYASAIDTTFALYLPEELQANPSFYAAIRTGAPYEARHLPWYKTGADETEEDRYYSTHKNADINHWDK